MFDGQKNILPRWKSYYLNILWPKIIMPYWQTMYVGVVVYECIEHMHFILLYISFYIKPLLWATEAWFTKFCIRDNLSIVKVSVESCWITFIFDMCPHSLTMGTPVRYGAIYNKPTIFCSFRKRFDFYPSMEIITFIIICEMKLLIPSQTSIMEPLKFVNG